ncbi:MAG: NADH-ubiquinone oxidoreductase-F iron-sulfur binding region domain-containing protein [Planctomycetaceae bacterium]
MKLIRELMQLQEERGYLSDETLREVSDRRRVPLYRLEGLVSFYTHFRRTPPPQEVIHVCRDVCCAMHQADSPTGFLTGEIHEVSCLGRCDAAPAVSINDRPSSGGSSLTGGRSIAVHVDPHSDETERYSTVRQFVQDLDALKAACVDRLTAAGLKGMGGAGFPTGNKWEFVAAAALNPPVVDDFALTDEDAKHPQKYVICNADESEPGTFKDREILAQLPHLVIEGMLLAGLTIGAERGILFIRHEYGPERERFETELRRAQDSGVLGPNAAGSGRAFDIEVFVSPGGYILGEETALLECLEDKRGEPRHKPPYPGERGLWGQPTLINNVETFALATSIIHHGPDWWRAQGKDGCSGLKFVCISGDVTNPGVFEIPVGTTVCELIEMAGGVRNGTPLKAFLPGGASSNLLPADKAATPLDFDAIRAAGSMLGTGAVIVFDESRDLFPLATNLVKFFRNESCGKCVPCRIGSQRAVELLELGSTPAAQSGRSASVGVPSLLPTLQNLNATLEQTSICSLGQVALHPILSMLQHFPNELPTSNGFTVA